MRTNEEMKSRIMRRVWGVYVVRKLTQPAIRLGVFISACIILAGSVSVPDVFANAFHVTTLEGLVSFTLAAFTSTSTLVQVAVIAGTIVALSSITDFAKRVVHRETYA
jgi:hypothetical protein